MAGDTTREKGGFMKCEEAAEFVSRLCDGQMVPREAAEHIGTCHVCLARLTAYLGSGAELRRLASLEQPAILKHRSWETAQNVPLQWWRKGRTTMRIPRLAFVAMLIVILALSSGLLMVRARAGAASGRFLELKLKPPSPAKPNICIMRADGSQKDNTCNFVQHGHEGLLLMNTRVVANEGGRAQVGVRAKYISVTQDTEVDGEALLKDVPETLLAVEPGAKQQVEVANLGTVEVEVEYLDHIPPLVYRPQETLDPSPQEFRIVAPVLVRDNQVIANADGASIDTGVPDATLMLYVPGAGRYLVSSVPFERAVEGTVHLGKITFSLEGHNYLLLTSMPITVLDRVWVKHEPDFKPSERMVRPSDARDDRIMYIVRSLKKLEEPRIEH